MFYVHLPEIAGWIAGIGIIAEVTNIPGLREVSGILQFGALGLCAYMVYDQRLERKQHREERKELVQSLQTKEHENKMLIENFTAATNRLAEALEDKPCLIGDQRIEFNKTPQ